jgi:hypothetical protein
MYSLLSLTTWAFRPPRFRQFSFRRYKIMKLDHIERFACNALQYWPSSSMRLCRQRNNHFTSILPRNAIDEHLYEYGQYPGRESGSSRPSQMERTRSAAIMATNSKPPLHIPEPTSIITAGAESFKKYDNSTQSLRSGHLTHLEV